MRLIALLFIALAPSPSNSAITPYRESEGIISFQSSFEDSSGATTRALAEHEGISLDDARSRLLFMADAARWSSEIEKALPDVYADAHIDTRNGQTLRVYIKGGSSNTIDYVIERSRDLVGAEEQVLVQQATYSKAELLDLGKSIIDQLRVLVTTYRS